MLIRRLIALGRIMLKQANDRAPNEYGQAAAGLIRA
jgi:hypothetical protein